MAHLRDLLKGFTGEATEALGFIESKAKELGVTIFLDDGDKNIFVPKSRLDQEINKNKNLNETIKSQNESLKSLETLTKDNEKAQKEIESMKTKNADLVKQMKSASIQSGLASKIAELNCIAPAEDILALIGTDNLVVQENGTVLGLDEALKTLQTSKPYLFSTKSADNGAGNTDPTGGQGGDNGQGAEGTGDPGKGTKNFNFGDNKFSPGAFGKMLSQNNAPASSGGTNFFGANN